MTALIAGFLLVGYLLAPGAIYRLVFSLYIPAKRFQRTRTEEVVFSVVATLLPFFVTAFLLLATPLGRRPILHSPVSKHTAYSIVLNSVLPGTDVSRDLVSAAYLRSFSEQSRFLLVLWALCALEGWLSGIIIRNYGNYPDDSFLKSFCDKTLLRHVSEWQILFTTFTLPTRNKSVRVEVDALSTTGVLYRGHLTNWFTDIDGKLAGIFLTEASRFKRDELDRDTGEGNARPPENYWKIIPGARLYLSAGSLANYNIRFVESGWDDPADEEASDLFTVTPLPAEDTEDDPAGLI